MVLSLPFTLAYLIGYEYGDELFYFVIVMEAIVIWYSVYLYFKCSVFPKAK